MSEDLSRRRTGGRSGSASSRERGWKEGAQLIQVAAATGSRCPPWFCRGSLLILPTKLWPDWERGISRLKSESRDREVPVKRSAHATTATAQVPLTSFELETITSSVYEKRWRMSTWLWPRDTATAAIRIEAEPCPPQSVCVGGAGKLESDEIRRIAKQRICQPTASPRVVASPAAGPPA